MPLINTNFAGVITFSRASGATWFNSAGNLIGVDFSITSNTIGTGSKTFTLTATAGVDRSWATGDTVLIVDQANSANNMTGTVTSYTASTQALVVNVTSTAGSGTITSWRIGNLMQRLDYDPSTLAAQGLLIEDARTNSIRNNTMQGAVAGTPGTLPTNWSDFYSGTGVTRTIVGTGTENGITYVDIRLSGTPSATATYAINVDTLAASASVGQTWTISTYYKLQAGSTANLNTRLGLIEVTGGGGYLTEQNFTVTPPTNAALSTQRASGTRTLTSATVGGVSANINFTLTAGQAIDITLRIGLPQLEQGAFATSVIPTTTTALTRSADVASVNTLSPWFNASAGTIYAETQLTNTVATNRAGFDLNDGSTNNRNIFRAFTTGSADQNTVRSGGSTVAALAAVTSPTTAVRKSAAAYAVDDFAFTANGGTPATDTLGAVPVGLTTFLLGSAAAGSEHLNGYLRRITYYPRRLSNAELQAITA